MSLFTDEKRRGEVWDALLDLTCEAHQNAKEHGFYDAHEAAVNALGESEYADRSAFQTIRRDFILAQLAKITSEVGEAVSAIQKGEPFMEELADIIIRTLDLGCFCSMPSDEIVGAIFGKMQKNRARPYLHGKLC